MKKIATIIIWLTTFFSIANITNADEEGAFEKLLNLNNWPFIYELSLPKLDNYNFKDASLRKTYTTFKKYDQIARNEIISKYDEWLYDYYTMKWIVRSYGNFIYNNNMFFNYLNMVDKNSYLKNDKITQDYVLKYYKATAESYQKVEDLLKTTY